MINFMGLGFSFGATDHGLGPALEGTSLQMTQLTEALDGVRNAASATSAPFEGLSTALDDVKLDFFDRANVTLDDFQEKANDGGGSFRRLADRVLGGAGRVVGAMGHIGAAVSPLVAVFGGAASAAMGMLDTITAPTNLREIGQTLAGIATRGVNLTTSLEAEAQQLGVTARATGANMGFVGQALDDFTRRAASMASGLNIGADQAALALRGWVEATDELRAIGFESERDFARFTAAFGVNADTLRDSALQMRNEFDLTDEQLNRVFGSVVAFGQASGDVAGAINNIPQLLNNMREQARLMGAELSPEQLADFTAQTQALAAGFFQVSQNSGDAREGATQIATALVEAQRDFQNMFAGTRDDLSTFIQEIAVIGGDVEGAFELMQSGPSGFVQGMTRMVAEARSHGMDMDRVMSFVGSRLEEALGPEAASRLVGFFRQADQATLDSMAQVNNATAALGELGRQAHRTGRTMQEQFDRMREAAFNSFRRLGRPEAREWLQRISESSRTMSARIQELGEDNGPLGRFARQMAEATHTGANAFIPDVLQGSVFWLGNMYDQMSPTIDALASMGIEFTSFSGLARSAGLGLAVFAARVIETRREGESWGTSIRRVADEFADIAVGWVDSAETLVTDLLTAFAEFDWNTVFDGGEDGEQSGMQRLLARLSQVDWTGLWQRLQQGFSQLFKMMQPWLEDTWEDVKTFFWGLIRVAIDNIPWRKILHGLGELAGQLWDALQPILQDVWNSITSWLMNNWHWIVLGVLGALVAVVAAVLVGIVVGTVAVMMAPFIAAIAAVVATAAAIWDSWGAEIEGFFTGIAATMQQVWTSITLAFQVAWTALKVWFLALWNQSIVAPITGAVGAITATWVTITTFFTSIWTVVETNVGAIIGRITGLFTGMGTSASTAFQGIMNTVQGLFGNSVNTIVGEDMAQTQEVVTLTTEQVSAMIRDVMFTSIHSAITEAFGQAYEFVIEATEGFGSTLEHRFAEMNATIVQNFASMWAAILEMSEIGIGELEMLVAESGANISRLQAMMLAAQTVQDVAREATHEAVRTPGALERAGGMEGLIDAVHQPDWWREYKTMFVQHMTALTRTVGAIGVPAGNSRGGRTGPTARERIAGVSDGFAGDVGVRQRVAVTTTGMPVTRR